MRATIKGWVRPEAGLGRAYSVDVTVDVEPSGKDNEVMGLAMEVTHVLAQHGDELMQLTKDVLLGLSVGTELEGAPSNGMELCVWCRAHKRNPAVTQLRDGAGMPRCFACETAS